MNEDANAKKGGDYRKYFLKLLFFKFRGPDNTNEIEKKRTWT
jgi:hypothetical protein